MSKQPEDLSFEDALLELEQIVAQLEDGSLSLEESLELFERGRSLAARCNHLLETAQLRIEQLTDEGEIVDVSNAF